MVVSTRGDPDEPGIEFLSEIILDEQRSRNDRFLALVAFAYGGDLSAVEFCLDFARLQSNPKQDRGYWKQSMNCAGSLLKAHGRPHLEMQEELVDLLTDESDRGTWYRGTAEHWLRERRDSLDYWLSSGVDTASSRRPWLVSFALVSPPGRLDSARIPRPFTGVRRRCGQTVVR